MPEVSLNEWNSFLDDHPDVHLLQTGAWGQLKAKFGWDVSRLVAGNAGVQILFRRLPMGYALAYIPKGPLGEGWGELWPEVEALCRTKKTIFLKLELDRWSDESAVKLPERFKPSSHAIQPGRTIVIDLQGKEEEILARMKQKTRYNIRLAGRKGVQVSTATDVAVFSKMMDVTGQRDDFGVHSQAYYQLAYELFQPLGRCRLLQADFEGQPLAALMVFSQGKRAWYLYGASNNMERNRMPAYLLQWEAMRWAREKGCTEYDLWGVPDEDEEVLEAKFQQRSDGLWGVYRFKRGFGGQIKRSVPVLDHVFKPALYWAYKMFLRFRRL